jgi:hypothetical protein
MNDDLERMWNEVVDAYYPGIWVEGLRKATQILIQNRRCPDQDSNRASPEYRGHALA